METLLTVRDAADMIGASVSLIQKRCKDGTLQSIRVGKTYRIQQSDLLAWVRHAPSQSPSGRSREVGAPDVLKFIDAWCSYLAHVGGLMPTTISTHRGSLVVYLKRLSTIPNARISISALFDRRNLLAVFQQIPPRSYALRLNTFNALISFGKFLEAEGELQAKALSELRPLKPRRMSDPRRTHLRPHEVERLFEAVLTRPRCAAADNLTVAAMLACMVYAGLRASEVCNLRPQDVDLEARVMLIRHGKGGKDRRVGISNALMLHLRRYQAIRKSGVNLFVRPDGGCWNRHKLAKRVTALSERLGVDITCHGLRRTFATLAANQGRSLNAIRIALGHSDLTTTQAYLRQTESEVVASMQEW